MFTPNDTLIHKGIAVMLMLAIHIFVRSSNTMYVCNWMIDGKQWLNPVFANEKICVTIFVLLSGYEINEIFNRCIGNAPFWRFSAEFMKSQLLKLYTNFWCVFLTFTGVGVLIGKVTLAGRWGTGVRGIVSFFVDFLGMQDVVTDYWKTPTLNATWWFMATIILLYLAFPTIKYAVQRLGWLPVLVGLALNFYAPLSTNRQFKTGVVFYFASFCFGILCSEQKLLEKFRQGVWNWKPWLQYAASASALVITFALRWHDRYRWDLVHALGMMFFVDVYFVRSPFEWVKKSLAFLGKHSSNIFMLHTFIVVVYWQNFTYSLRYPILIFLFLQGSSLACSVLLENLKERTGFNKLQRKICAMAAIPEQNALSERIFDRKETLKAKGIAICMLLFHHLFYSAQRVDANGVNFFLLSKGVVMHIATAARICVWVFAFLSAYGLSKNYMALGDRPDGKQCAAFVKKRWLALMKPYWLVFALTFLGLSLLGKDAFASFGGSYRNMVLNFFGIADLFGVKIPVAAWWYMCFAQVLVLLLPVLFELCRKFGWLTLIVAFLAGPYLGAGINSQFGGSYMNYLTVVLVGILFAQNGTMERLGIKPKSWILQGLEFVGMIIIAAVCVEINIRYANGDSWRVTKLFMAAAAAIICLFSYKYLTLGFLEKILSFLGKHSGTIFLLHAFTYTFWPHRVYWAHNVPVTFLTILAVSLAGSMVCEQLMKLLIPKKTKI